MKIRNYKKLKPYKVIKLKTGIEVEHYANGKIKVK